VGEENPIADMLVRKASERMVLRIMVVWWLMGSQSMG